MISLDFLLFFEISYGLRRFKTTHHLKCMKWGQILSTWQLFKKVFFNTKLKNIRMVRKALEVQTLYLNRAWNLGVGTEMLKAR